jgi:hypothetical protein
MHRLQLPRSPRGIGSFRTEAVVRSVITRSGSTFRSIGRVAADTRRGIGQRNGFHHRLLVTGILFDFIRSFRRRGHAKVDMTLSVYTRR